MKTFKSILAREKFFVYFVLVLFSAISVSNIIRVKSMALIVKIRLLIILMFFNLYNIEILCVCRVSSILIGKIRNRK